MLLRTLLAAPVYASSFISRIDSTQVLGLSFTFFLPFLLFLSFSFLSLFLSVVIFFRPSLLPSYFSFLLSSFCLSFLLYQFFLGL